MLGPIAGGGSDPITSKVAFDELSLESGRFARAVLDFENR